MTVSYAVAPGSNPGPAPIVMSNNGPKNFKEMQFPPARDGARNSVYAPLPPAPPPRAVSASEIDKRTERLLEMKVLVNAARCPLCGGQLDGPVTFEGASLYCITFTSKEYHAVYNYGYLEPACSIATIYTTNYAYEIVHNRIEDNKFQNEIYKIDLSLNERNQQASKELFTKFEGARFFLSKKLSEKKLLEKIKLYTVFS